MFDLFEKIQALSADPNHTVFFSGPGGVLA
jgi:hypothetical protein